ncbi:MAG: hypothetical protein GX628_09430 [Clostridiales bacterium]|nr:hypothetical protein [Clostridiales bacterium]
MNRKHLAAALLAALMILTTLLSACGGGSAGAGKPAADTTTAAEETTAETTSALEQLGAMDFDGRKYTIYDNNTVKIQTNVPGDSLNGEIVNDALFNRGTYMRDRYNVEMIYFDAPDVNAYRNSVLADEDNYQLGFSPLFSMTTNATGGILYDLCSLPYMELDKNWWSPLFYEQFRLNGRMYIATGDITPGTYQTPCCLFLNLKLYDDYGIETDIYQLVLDGGWTIDELTAVVKDYNYIDLNQDTKQGIEDFYGIVMQHTTETTEAFLTAAGNSLASVSKDGTGLEFNMLDNDKVLTAIEKLQPVCPYINYAEINDPINLCFKVDRGLFLQHKLESAATHLRDMESPYLILPDPKYDEAQEQYISCVSGWCYSFPTIPSTADPEFAGFMAEALARYSHENIRPLAYEVVYKDRDTRDPRSADILDLLFNSLYIDFGVVYNFGSIKDALTQVLFEAKPFASTVESKVDAINAAMAKVIENW